MIQSQQIELFPMKFVKKYKVKDERQRIPNRIISENKILISTCLKVLLIS